MMKIAGPFNLRSSQAKIKAETKTDPKSLDTNKFEHSISRNLPGKYEETTCSSIINKETQISDDCKKSGRSATVSKATMAETIKEEKIESAETSEIPGSGIAQVNLYSENDAELRVVEKDRTETSQSNVFYKGM